MIDDFKCPVCRSNEWEELKEESYNRGDITALSPYLQTRYNILFSVWFSGRAVARIVSILCRSCGFVAFTPRPTETEVDKKYKMDVLVRESTLTYSADSQSERLRANKLYRDFSPYLKPHSEILDYGGNDGRLMLTFLGDGHRCYLVDYALHPIQGVVRLAATISKVERDRTFDAIVVNHVLEHVAEPFELLCSLRAHHRSGGFLYIEVPMELWGRVPPGKDPVTHINFFTPPAMEVLLRRAGYEPKSCRLKWHHVNRRRLVVRAIASCSDGVQNEGHIYRGSVEYSRSMMGSSFRGILRIAAAEWTRLPFVARHMVRHSILRKAKCRLGSAWHALLIQQRRREG